MVERSDFRACALVPYYDHPGTLPRVVAALRRAGLPVVVVDDASPPASRRIADETTQNDFGGEPPVVLIRHAENRGKGAAVISGLRYAARQGFTHVVQVDADAQHDLSRFPSLMAVSREAPGALVIGQAVYDETVPPARYYGRYLTHVWVWINCLSLEVRDSMCGFRVYPVDATLAVIDDGGRRFAQRMGFDVEVCVRWEWTGMPVVNFPVKVIYSGDRPSHFRPFLDNLEISWMHTRCFFGMLLRAPRLLLRRVQG